MKLKIVRTPKGTFWSGHVLLFAWSEKKDEVYHHKKSSKKNVNVRKIRFDFGPIDYESFNEHAITFLSLDGQKQKEDRNSVILESNVHFEVFCKNLIKSEFYSSKNYKPRTKNCVHAIMYALKIAGIKLDIETDQKKTKHLLCCLWAPSTIVTPRELISSLKEYKQEANEEKKVENEQRPMPLT